MQNGQAKEVTVQALQFPIPTIYLDIIMEALQEAPLSYKKVAPVIMYLQSHIQATLEKHRKDTETVDETPTEKRQLPGYPTMSGDGNG